MDKAQSCLLSRNRRNNENRRCPYFSPHYRFSDLDFDNLDVVASAFQGHRVEGFYFHPAARLIEVEHAFAAGLVICAGIEFIAAAWRKEKPEDWLKNNLQVFAVDKSLANQFWQHFRHGLAHEGRIKSFGQFSLALPETVVKESGRYLPSRYSIRE